MQIIATFDSTIYLEIAIKQIEKRGIHQDNIFAVPLNNREESRDLFDSIHRADGVSLIDMGMALATAFSVVGISIGLRLAWGPILWGLITALFGFVLGFIIKLIILLMSHKNERQLKRKHAEIVLIVECDERFAAELEEILWNHLAFGVAWVKPIHAE
ncbi:hypothetical protein WMZ97_03620 [Lentibacillus sp. N15]|uniref:hypothetical protein n=1 Tax=Lentibacillus songyuanensis TaxID=3136161 RepID=UPI0031B9AD0C